MGVKDRTAHHLGTAIAIGAFLLLSLEVAVLLFLRFSCYYTVRIFV